MRAQPHIVRVLVGADHRRVLLAAALLGGVFLIAADIAARTLQAPVELPIGVVTAAAGTIVGLVGPNGSGNIDAAAHRLPGAATDRRRHPGRR